MPKIDHENYMAIAVLTEFDPNAPAERKADARAYLSTIDKDFVQSLRGVAYRYGYIMRRVGNGTFTLSSKGEELMKKAEKAGVEIPKAAVQ